MVINKVMSIYVDPMELMSSAPFDCYLTGSRYFGNADHKSDWDFFTQDSNETRKWLLENGFRPVKNSQYISTEIVDVFYHEAGNIHVQLVYSESIKAVAQGLLYQYGQMAETPKEARKYLWDFALAYAVDMNLDSSLIGGTRAKG